MADVLYVGNGAFRPGVPARDMTADEWTEVAADERTLCLSLGLYIINEPPKAVKARAMTAPQESHTDER